MPSCDFKWKSKALSSDLHMTGMLPTHTWKGTPTQWTRWHAPEDREVRAEEIFLWQLKQMPYSGRTDSVPVLTVIYWAVTCTDSWLLQASLLLFYEMGIIVSPLRCLLSSCIFSSKRGSLLHGLPHSWLNSKVMWKPWKFDPWVEKSHLGKWLPTPVLAQVNPMGRRPGGLVHRV